MNDYEAQATGLQVLDRKVFASGETIFREGEAGTRAYVIQRGHVDIIKKIEGEKITVGTVGPGGIFGEMALIDDEPRMASAVVSDYCVCIIITSVMFQKKMSGLDPFLSGVLRVLVENIRSIQNSKQDAKAIEAMFIVTSDDQEELEQLLQLDGSDDESAFEIA